jgi:hypothetical protein
VLLFSCKTESGTEIEKSEDQAEFTDIIKLNFSNYYLKFNSFDLFDTNYRSYHANMCSAPNEYLTFSKAGYNCEDSFEVMHRIIEPDSMLNLRIAQNWTQTEKHLDQNFLDFEIDKFMAAKMATKSNTKIQFQSIILIDKILVAYFGYKDSTIDKKERSGLNAFTIADSTVFSLYFYYAAQNCSEKLIEFENILKTICVYKQ